MQNSIQEEDVAENTPANLFADPAWRPFPFELAKQIGANPNRLYHNPDKRIGAVVAFRGDYDSWAINEKALNYIRDAVRDSRIARGYAILAVDHPKRVISVMEIDAVMKILTNETPREGNLGRYFWVYAGFATQETVDMADAPF